MGFFSKIFGGGSGSPQVSTSQVQIPGYIQDAGKFNINFAKNIANTPFQKFTGDRYAGFDTNEQQAFDRAVAFSNAGVGQDAISTGMDAASAAAGYTPQGFLGADISGYMNPYLQNVAGNVMSDLDRARQTALTSGGAAATRSGAYGGSRHGVSDALTNREFFDSANNALTNLYSQGYNQATNLFQNDIANQLAANSLNLNAASQLANLANMGRQFTLSDIDLQRNIGSQTRALEQAQRDFDYQQFVEQREDPYKKLAALSTGLGSTPYSTTTTGVTPAAQNNVLGSALGGALTGASLFGAGGLLAGAGGIGAAGGAGIGAGLGLLMGL